MGHKLISHKIINQIIHMTFYDWSAKKTLYIMN